MFTYTNYSSAILGIYTNLKPLSLYIEDPGSIKNAICEDHELAELCQHVSICVIPTISKYCLHFMRYALIS